MRIFGYGLSRVVATTALCLAGLAGTACAQVTDDASHLAKQTQNPVADLISLPFQGNFNFGFGPHERTQFVLNVQPVIPARLSPTLNLITRIIGPLISQPVGGDESTFGLGDVTPSFMLSPVSEGGLITGYGAIFLLPTATDDALGAGKWGAGPQVVVLGMPGNWVVGGLANQIWSFAGDEDRADVSGFLLQPFVNYNFGRGTAISSAPIITADWNRQGEKWIVPLGGGVSQLLKVGKRPVSLLAQGYVNVVKPEGAPDWTLRVAATLLFPR